MWVSWWRCLEDGALSVGYEWPRASSHEKEDLKGWVSPEEDSGGQREKGEKRKTRKLQWRQSFRNLWDFAITFGHRCHRETQLHCRKRKKNTDICQLLSRGLPVGHLIQHCGLACSLGSCELSGTLLLQPQGEPRRTRSTFLGWNGSGQCSSTSCPAGVANGRRGRRISGIVVVVSHP